MFRLINFWRVCVCVCWVGKGGFQGHGAAGPVANTGQVEAPEQVSERERNRLQKIAQMQGGVAAPTTQSDRYAVYCKHCTVSDLMNASTRCL